MPTSESQILYEMKRRFAPAVPPSPPTSGDFGGENSQVALREYLKAVRDELGKYPAPGFQRLKTISLMEEDDLFIPPQWGYLNSTKNEEANLIDILAGGLSTREQSHILIIAEPGQGKSLVLKRLFVRFADAFQNETGRVVPLFVNLSDIASKQYRGSLKWFWEFLKDPPHGRPSLSLTYQQFLQGTKVGLFVVLLDAFDEIAVRFSTSAIETYTAGAMFDLPAVVSCRTNFYESFLRGTDFGVQYASVIDLRSFTFDDKVRQYLKVLGQRYGDFDAGTVIEAIEDSVQLRDLVARPLLLNMVAEVFSRKESPMKVIGQTPKQPKQWTLAALYQGYVRSWLAIEADKPDAKLSAVAKEAAMEELSWHLYSDPTSDQMRSLGFTRRQIRDHFKKNRQSIAGLAHRVEFTDLVDDICNRTFLITRYGDRYVYVHKSFYEYFAAAHLFSALISRSESVPEAFKTFISAEVAGFLKGMLVEGASEVEKHIAVKSLIGVYQSFQESKSEREILARQQATHYLGRLGTREAVKFLEKSLESEPDKWVHRGIILGLALFCEQPKQTSQYISELEKDEEAASINIGYHLAYYGDQEFREDGADYYDRGHPECKWTVRAILRHLQTLDYSASWPLDLFTLRLLLESKVRSENAMLALHEDPRQWDFLSNRLDEYQHYADPVIVSNSSRIKEILRDRL